MWKWEAEGNARAVIVIVHGAMEHHRRYGWLIEQWRNAGFHVVMGDLPGHGLTTRSSRGHIDSFEEYVNEVKKWIDASYQFDLPVFLIGHSMGGLITIRLLQKERLNVAGVILSSPCLGLVNKPSPILHAATIILNKVFPALRVSSGISLDMVTRNEDVRELDRKDTLYVKKVSVRWYRELEEAMKNAFAMIKRTQDTPLLVVQGGDDRVVDKEKVRNWFNSVPLSEKRFKEWPKCYHEVFNEPEREEVFLYVQDFVEGQLRGLGYIV
ncbi:alpha/beta hydrolase [Robertmurraya korlensis]|uniref:alpha/beta hydrolase n=1 Tax=Robertmurraya korlensis TaxID=519977 RepID=UPI000825C9B3|nr:alpha/beta hydrolase [Robertmurraya korlensis]